MTRSERIVARYRVATRNVRTSTTVGLWVFGLTALGLLIASFIVPPSGVIDQSVLKGGSLLFAFAALFTAREAIAEGLGVKLTHGQTTVVVHDMDGNAGKEEEEAPAPADEEAAADE